MPPEVYLKKRLKLSRLRHRLVRDGLKNGVCEICGQSEMWNGKPLRLQVHHVDADNLNNELGNLQVLCPNCHTQTDNWCRPLPL